MTADALAVLESLPREELPEARSGEPDEWPGVADPDGFRAQLADWLAQYANPGTRRTYAYALGLPVAFADAIGGKAPGAPAAGPRPPAATRGPLHALAWFRWCAARRLDPRAATASDVKAWLHALDAAGAQRRTRQRMLATLSALYGYLAESRGGRREPGGAATARGSGCPPPPGTPHRPSGSPGRNCGPCSTRRHGRRHPRSPALASLYTRRAVAVVALLTLGLRISELTGLDRDDLYRTGGDDVLRVLGKGGLHREVYLTGLARDALTAYLAERDRFAATAVPARQGQAGSGAAPLVATRTGGRCSRFDLYTVLRRIAVAAGPALDGAADRVHPHALRHAYVTIALEQDARIQHVQADVGHATIATTQLYDRGRRTRASTAADLVAQAIDGAHETRRPPGDG